MAAIMESFYAFYNTLNGNIALNQLPDEPVKEEPDVFKLSDKPTVKEIMPGLQKTLTKEESFKKVDEQLKTAQPMSDENFLVELQRNRALQQAQLFQQTPSGPVEWTHTPNTIWVTSGNTAANKLSSIG